MTKYHFVLLGLLLAVPSSAEEGSPRLLSAAEGEAVAMAAAYLSDGPEAWWPRLAEDSPLRQLDQATGMAAIEVRAGPPDGARWQLRTVSQEVATNRAVFTIEFPSGMEETLLLRLHEDSDGWKIGSIRMSGEPLGGFGALGVAADNGVVSEVATAEAGGRHPDGLALGDQFSEGEAGQRDSVLPAVLGLIAAIFLILAIRRGLWFAVVGVALGAAGLALFFLGPLTQPSETILPVADVAEPETELAGLLDFRRAMANADSAAIEAAREALETPPASSAVSEIPPSNSAAQQVAQLWEAQAALFAGDLNAAEAFLQALPKATNLPQAERLRGRLGFSRLSEIDTALAYERLLEISIRDDGLLFEAAQAFDLLGFPHRAKRYADELEELGTRDADFYYSRAGVAVTENVSERAERAFRRGWKLKPLPRDAVMKHVLLAHLVDYVRPLWGLLDLASPKDPQVSCEGVSSQPVSLPAGSRATLVGAFLHLEVGEGELEVPGGCAMAPEDVENLDAGTWRERRESSVLEALASPSGRLVSKQDLSRPQGRQEIEMAVEALAREGRWSDLLDLTESLGTETAGVPPAVVRKRAEALQRANRGSEARDLLVALAAGNARNRQADPGTLFQLANLLVEEAEYDRALKVLAKAHSQLPFELDQRRMRQVRMEQRLVNASAVYESDHFKILYPFERSLYFAERTAEILEAERKRLMKWIPVSGAGKTEVLLIETDDFRGYVGSSEIVGLFDGKIRVPFAQVNTFTPLVVSILTHELAHAMITEATKDRAPRWLQEGLAQHVEMPQAGINPIAGYISTGSQLSFPMIERVLAGFVAAAAGSGCL